MVFFDDYIRNSIDISKEDIWDAVKWFKTKNKYKRSLSEHDEKAWRMIKKRLKNGKRN